MVITEKVSIFWFRRDLRLDDNRGLSEALKGEYPVLPVFIFDNDITDELTRDDPRITFIYDQLRSITSKLKDFSSSLFCMKGSAENVWKSILDSYIVHAVYANEDYEPYAIKRDNNIRELLLGKGIEWKVFKDHVVFAKDDILKNDHSPYSVFTPYRNKWMNTLKNDVSIINPVTFDESNFLKIELDLPDLEALGFKRSGIKVLEYKLNDLDNYDEERNFPALNKTSLLSPHLRFGTLSIRSVLRQTLKNQPFVNELVWREFFMQILFHYPHVVHASFKSKYDNILWRNNQKEFERWKIGETGYPMVDAGMRELNNTGYMHNRVRMIVAGFMCKHLLIDWRWGEAYFAEKLLDYELSSNNGNWQWAAGTGCDAAPYFRIFNPAEQLKKFDPEMIYVKKWIPELGSSNYPAPIVEHKKARLRAIETYKKGLNLNT